MRTRNINVIFVPKVLSILQDSMNTKTFTLERSLLSVNSALAVLLTEEHVEHIKEVILVINETIQRNNFHNFLLAILIFNILAPSNVMKTDRTIVL